MPYSLDGFRMPEALPTPPNCISIQHYNMKCDPI